MKNEAALLYENSRAVFYDTACVRNFPHVGGHGPAGGGEKASRPPLPYLIVNGKSKHRCRTKYGCDEPCAALKGLPETGETAPEAESENTWTKHDFRFDIIEQIS